MSPKLKVPSLAFHLLLCLVLSYVLAAGISFEVDTYFCLLSCFSVLLMVLNFILKRRAFLKVKLKSVVLYFLFLTFCMLRYEVYVEGQNYLLLSLQNTDEAVVVEAEFIQGKVSEGNYSPLLFEVNTVFLAESKFQTKEKLLVVYFQDSTQPLLQIGEVLCFRANLSPISNSTNPGAFDALSFWENKGVRTRVFLRSDQSLKVGKNHRWQQVFSTWREKLAVKFEGVLASKEAGIAKALVLGDKSDLNTDVKDDFTAAGAMHVLAVSGLHVGILLFCLQFFFQKIPFLRKKNLYFIVALVVLWGYAFLTGASPSVIRATTMFTFLVLGKLRGKGMFSMEVLISTAFLMLLLSPAYLKDIGFQLSFSAMFSIALFFEGIKNLLHFKQGWLHKIWEGTALCFAAQLGTLPLSLYYFHQLPNYFLITNLVLLLMAFAAMFSGLLFLVTSVLPFVSDLTAFLLKISFNSLSSAMEEIASWPYALTQGIQIGLGSMFVLYALLLFIQFQVQLRRLKLILIAGVVFFLTAGWIVKEREASLREVHLFVLEAKGPALLFSLQGNHHVVYESSNPSLRKELAFVLKNYQQKNGGEISFHPLEDERISIGELQVEVRQDSLYLNYHSLEHHLALKDKQDSCLEIRLP
ncbi:competence protein ComEC [Lishizhenia tianjinensis]|uniref:Competence protein ComEC n=1 Tax=Lishizhenia tianjinensis TaxID=477690 RepID=A0A1I7A448_9FLAO|nr:ComEC/Rec2 family competence protein [Lishizhenia tianjinensis]SFT69718.1 competence protein ComEC [Lishizhenia tianjinensis]